MVSVPARRAGVAYATGTRPVATAGLHAARCRAIGVALSLDEGGEGCAGAGADGGAGGAVSALRLPADRDLPRPRRSRDELRPGASAVAAGAAAGAAQAPTKAHRDRPRPRPNAPTGANQVWSYDFVFDWCANGQQLKCLTVTDEWTKEGLAIEVDGRIRSGRVIEVLSRLVSRARRTTVSALDNGPEFVSRALLKWIVDQGIDTALIDPGKPWQNGATESFNGKFRDECLSLEWFRSRTEAKVLIEAWRQHFNDGAAAFEPRLSHAGRVRGEARGARRSGRPCDGADRCGIWGLRAPPRRTTVPQGANERSNRGGRLKLNVVRRNRAGQSRREDKAVSKETRSRKRTGDGRLNVYADGIELHKAGPTGGYFTKEFASTSKLSILNAGKGEYEALILDLLGID